MVLHVKLLGISLTLLLESPLINNEVRSYVSHIQYVYYTNSNLLYFNGCAALHAMV